MTPEQQNHEKLRNEEISAIDWHNQAFERKSIASAAVHLQLLPLGNGNFTTESLAELDDADVEYLKAKANMNRLENRHRR